MVQLRSRLQLTVNDPRSLNVDTHCEIELRMFANYA
jgi:hypothetical protein